MGESNIADLIKASLLRTSQDTMSISTEIKQIWVRKISAIINGCIKVKSICLFFFQRANGMLACCSNVSSFSISIYSDLLQSFSGSFPCWKKKKSQDYADEIQFPLIVISKKLNFFFFSLLISEEMITFPNFCSISTESHCGRSTRVWNINQHFTLVSIICIPPESINRGKQTRERESS